MASKRSGGVGPPRRRRTGTTRSRSKPVADLLILECDHKKLACDGLSSIAVSSLCATFTDWLWARAPRRRLEVLLRKADTQKDLVEIFADIAGDYSQVRSVLLIGHSSSERIQLAKDYFVPWSVAGRFLEPLKPEYLALLACKAGGKRTVTEFASEIPTVREVIATPATATKPLVIYLSVWLVARVRGRQIPADAAVIGQLANMFLGQNIALHWTPESCREISLEDIFIDLLMEEGAVWAIEKIRRAFRESD